MLQIPEQDGVSSSQNARAPVPVLSRVEPSLSRREAFFNTQPLDFGQRHARIRILSVPAEHGGRQPVVCGMHLSLYSQPKTLAVQE
jgi:hypothetical protein